MTEKAPALVCIDGPEDDAFPVTITVRNLKGVASTITFDCIPRTVTQLAELQDKATKEMEAAKKAAEHKPGDGAEGAQDAPAALMADSHRQRFRRDAEYIMTIAKGWNLTNKFNLDSLEKLEDKFPGAAMSLAIEYGKTIYGQREKN